MSARDDYPYFPNPRTHAIERRVQYDAMCDEIDRLRANNAVYEKDVMPRLLDRNRLVAALDELIRELTAHADAMRDDLAAADGLIALAAGRPYEQRDTITAYDEFVKEC